MTVDNAPAGFDNRGKGKVRNGFRHSGKADELIVQLTSGEKTVERRARDISRSGIFVEDINDMQPGQAVRLSIPYPDRHLHITIDGKVVRVTDEGVAIQFEISSFDLEG